MIYCFSCSGSLRLGFLKGSKGGKKKRVHSLQVWNIMHDMFDFQFCCCCCWVSAHYFAHATFSMLHHRSRMGNLSRCSLLAGFFEVNRWDKKKPQVIFFVQSHNQHICKKMQHIAKWWNSFMDKYCGFDILGWESVLCTLTPKRLLKDVEKRRQRFKLNTFPKGTVSF